MQWAMNGPGSTSSASSLSALSSSSTWFLVFSVGAYIYHTVCIGKGLEYSHTHMHTRARACAHTRTHT